MVPKDFAPEQLLYTRLHFTHSKYNLILSITEKNGITKWLKLDSVTSAVWNYFGFPAEDKRFLELNKKKRNHVCCKLCGRDFSYVGNTTNMWQHLKEAHPSENHGLKSSGEDLTNNLGSYSCNISSSSIANKQIPITEFSLLFYYKRHVLISNCKWPWISLTGSVVRSKIWTPRQEDFSC